MDVDPGNKCDPPTPKNPSFIPSFIDDGRLEVIGREDSRSDWALLDQVRGIRFEFIEGAKGTVCICIDGAPWIWPILTNDLVEIEISYHGQVNILALPDCAAKSIHLSSQSSVSQANAKDLSERREFNATAASLGFSLPD
ncbi:diacylglycerol kinase 5-like [Prunus yedoensis var. nudiflora]|uniref:Diacylglycerol kinase 5-like n=1 Tax=Prunus yedoensis var. nudiflora TaxID=2094558 RepID=A0A314Y9E9_PRUYE|nr:diacylglycerol kinase 5-like [Prunus yedoensis var. nudiflora]